MVDKALLTFHTCIIAKFSALNKALIFILVFYYYFNEKEY